MVYSELPYQVEALKIFSDTGAYLTGLHVVLASKKHGDAYVDKDRVYPYTTKVSRLCEMIAESFKQDDIEVVIAPEKGGIILSQWVAFHLSQMTGREVLAVYAEKDGKGGFTFTRGRGAELIKGKRALVVEDVFSTGESVMNVVIAARNHDSNVMGVAGLWNRGGVGAEAVGNPPKFISLISKQLDMWPAEKGNCPLCDNNTPITTEVGHGKKYLAEKAADTQQ